MGDIILFDYNIIHRSVPNTSPQMRSLLYLTFSRHAAEPQACVPVPIVVLPVELAQAFQPLPPVPFDLFTYRPWFKDVGNFDNPEQVEIAVENAKPSCAHPLEFAVGSGRASSPAHELEHLDRVVRHARYAEVCASSATAPVPLGAAIEMEDIPELFPILNQRFHDAGFEFEDEDENDGDGNGEGEGEGDCASDGTCEVEDGQSSAAETETTRRTPSQRLDFACAARAFFTAPLVDS